MRRLLIFIVVFAVVFVVLQFHDAPSLTTVTVPLAALDPDGDGMVQVPKPRPLDSWDKVTGSIIVLTSALSVLALMVGSHYKRDWSWQGLGMFGVYMGDTLIFLGIIGPALGLWARLATPEWYADTYRAFFLAGCPILAFCLVRWMVARPASVEEQIEAGRVAGYAAGAESERVEVAEQIEVGRSDGHAAGRVAERLTVNGDIQDAHDAGLAEGRAEGRS
jgi:hypothetical protein